MEQITLSGGQFHITESADTFHRVKKGHVLVYLVPVTEKDGKESYGRRMLLKEAVEDETIPSLCHDSEYLGSWRFMFMALDHAELSAYTEKEMDEIRLSFAESIGIRLFSADDFDEEIIERYNLYAVKEETYIFATKEEESNTLKQSAMLIYNIFRKDKPVGEGYAPTGNALYDAVSYICHKEHIEVASFDRIKQAAGRKFGISDISRISHFTAREVVLAGDWYKKDSGPLLAFAEDGKKPVPCIPKGSGHYEGYDTETGEKWRIDGKSVKELGAKGYTFYRPFPNKPIGKKDLFLFGIRKVYMSDLLRLFLLALLGTGVGLLIPVLNQYVYDLYIPLGDMNGLIAVGVVILSCSIGNISFSIVKNLASFRSMNKMEYAVQNAAIDRLFNLPESFFRDYDAAGLSQRVMGVSSIYQVLADNLTQAALTALFSTMYLFNMFRYSKDMSTVALILLFVTVAVLGWLGIRQTGLEKEKMLIDMEGKSAVFQFISGIEKIRISASENRAILRYLESFTKSQSINARKERTTNLVGVVSAVASSVFSLVFYFLMIRKSIDLSVGRFSGFTSAFGSFSGAMFTLLQSFLMVNMIKPVYENARPILETLPELSDDMALPGDLSGEIEVSHVTFSYSDTEDPVLNDLNIHIKAGEYVAIVGSSGCGKSTLLKLLLGFEKPRTGKIYYDNTDIDEMDKRELRKKFGVVLQDGGMIAGSIYENIVITAPQTSIERVQEVIEEVGLKDDIDNMPMGIHTVVMEGAGTISGGQRQRILIARALVGKPKLVFFDEATSALDNVTQNMVVETLEKIKATKIVIAHRLSTVRRCDRIIVMDHGRIIEEGDYESLMEKKGFFYDLAIRQL